MPEIPKLVNRGPAGLLSKENGKLTNRGPAGLLTKPESKGQAKSVAPQRPAKGPIDRIRCAGAVVAIKKLMPDPDNARTHPDRNIASIEDSLNLHGLMSPITVNKNGMVVVKGNGTLQAAKNLGWTKLACSVIDMKPAEAAGYGLADNRSAELAKWDFEVVARLDQLIQEAGGGMVGWTADELEVLRAADWTPPEVSEDSFGGNGDGKSGPLLIGFNPDQKAMIDKAVAMLRGIRAEDELDEAEALEMICAEWLKGSGDA